jgi:hypothetical protein
MESTRIYKGLVRVGFTLEQIEHLCQLRHAYAEGKRAQVMAEQRRLEFVRWLVETGRLTDDF